MAQITVQQAIKQARQLHDAGRFAEAERLYRLALARQPDSPVALAGLGSLAYIGGRPEIAVDLITRAIARQPDDFTYYNDLAGALRAVGRLPEAIAAYRSAIQLQPNSAELWNNLGSALTHAGQADEAIEACEKAVSLNPRLPELYCNLGDARRAKGLLDDAMKAYRQAIELRANYLHAHLSLAAVLVQCGKLEEAIEAYHGAERSGDTTAELQFQIGDVLRMLGRIDEAIAAYRTVIARQPNLAEAYDNLGGCLNMRSQYVEAESACRKSIELKPDRLVSYLNLSHSLFQQGRYEAAVEAAQRASQLGPEHAESYHNLGQLYVEQGRVGEGIETFREGLRHPPDSLMVRQGMLMAMHYLTGTRAEELFREHLQCAEIHAKPRAALIRPHRNDRSPERRLRVGYVSPDFRRHSVPRFIAEIFKAHDRSGFEVFGYTTRSDMDADAVTGSLRASCDHWRTLADKTDAQAAEMIEADAIDILVDLAGHSGANRLMIFALKPAPVQVTYVGYPNTTGLTTIDYRITDAFADPPGTTEQWHTETLVRLPRTAWCFERPESQVDVAPPPSLERGFITFGSFNVIGKLSVECIALWSKILLAVPGSRLLLKNKSLGDPMTADRLRDVFAKQGIEAGRLDFLGLEQSHVTHLEHYRRMDIALDPFPYHGTTTTCEALWMGVPVVTLAGQTHVSRVGVSLLNNVGLKELIAENADDYARIAVTLAGHRDRLGELHGSLRGMLEKSPVMNATQFTAELEAAYRDMWRRWCERPT